MIALLQRVLEASVVVSGQVVGEIGPGLLVFLGVERGDGLAEADRLVERVLTYRIFDDAGRMNLSLVDKGLPLLVVSQFTLAADTQTGTRPGFQTAAPPDEGRRLYDYFVQCAQRRIEEVETGRFGADMKVRLVNDGPVTFSLRVPPPAKAG